MSTKKIPKIVHQKAKYLIVKLQKQIGVLNNKLSFKIDKISILEKHIKSLEFALKCAEDIIHQNPEYTKEYYNSWGAKAMYSVRHIHIHKQRHKSISKEDQMKALIKVLPDFLKKLPK